MTIPPLKYSLLFISLVLVSPAGSSSPCIPTIFLSLLPEAFFPFLSFKCWCSLEVLCLLLFILHILTEQLTPISSIKFHILRTLKSIFLTQASLMSSIPINWLMRHLCLDNLEAFHLNLSKAKPFILPFILYLLFSEWDHHLLIAKSET